MLVADEFLPQSIQMGACLITPLQTLLKLILREEFEPTRIYYRDNRSYFNVLLDDNIRKWICRLGFNSSNKYIQLNDEMKTSIKIESVNDIQNYKNEIINVAKQFA
ncbi:hypothetical protein ABH916_002342 [Peribacillus frigoritolerans]|uniref:hypothetical protein n=1 Tax=Peribacillus frigoritolerans TaxID=450367 RepID=UPI0020D245F4